MAYARRTDRHRATIYCRPRCELKVISAACVTAVCVCVLKTSMVQCYTVSVHTTETVSSGTPLQYDAPQSLVDKQATFTASVLTVSNGSIVSVIASSQAQALVRLFSESGYLDLIETVLFEMSMGLLKQFTVHRPSITSHSDVDDLHYAM